MSLPRNPIPPKRDNHDGAPLRGQGLPKPPPVQSGGLPKPTGLPTPTGSRPQPPQRKRPSREQPPAAPPVPQPTIQEEIQDGDRLEWVTDPRTGKKYRPLPKTKTGPDGRPLLAVNDLNLDDMTGEADVFLAHLRVPPTEEELARWAEARRIKDEREARELAESTEE